MYELHFSTRKNGAPTIHVAGCAHGHPGHVRVEALTGATLVEAKQDGMVEDHDENVAGFDPKYTVKTAPCAKGA